MRGFGKLDGDLAFEVPSSSGSVKRYDGLLRRLSEVGRHEGQIAYVCGAIRRRRQKEPYFLT